MKQDSLSILFRLAGLAMGCLSTSLSAQVYPLSENSWSNPDFVKRFMGSYGVDTNVNPSIEAEERDLFTQVSAAAERSIPQAINILRTGITATSSAAFDYILANFYFQEGQNSAAIRAYEAAIRKFPNFRRAYLNIGRVYVMQNQYDRALPNLLKALELGSGDGNIYGLVGYCHLNLNNPGNALDAYRFALVFEPESRDWRLGQLKSLLALQRFDEAEGILYRYIAERPDVPEFWLQQANVFVAQKKFAKAAANLMVVDSLGGTDKSSLVLLGDLFVNLDAPLLAIEPYEDAIATGQLPGSEALNLAKALSRRLATSSARGARVSATRCR